MATFELSDAAPDQEHGASRPMWLRSTYCEHANCVEVSLGEDVLIRDSTFPDQPSLVVAPDAYRAFITAVKNGLFVR
ncbi:DUF397 domain-containing protein [Phytohabitans kaempferiae]|uniref:DUF397 domain-containing protein n=1 Tax=Phytohabitans kaempferiae TaxID=1620943 RepID=A0ABV6ME23_9ACTN